MKDTRRYLGFATILALLFSAFFLRGYFSMFVIAGTLTYLFWPLYTKLNTKFKQSTATILTLLASFLTVLIPVSVVGAIALQQVDTLIGNASEIAKTADLGELGEQAVIFANDTVNKLPFVETTITQESLTKNLQKVATNVGTAVIDFAANAATSIFGLVSSSIIFIFLFVSLLYNGPKLIKDFRDINPLGHSTADLYLKRAAAMVKGSVKGQFIIAFVQGFIGAVTLSIAGLPDYFFVIWIIFTLFSVVPLGSGIIALPIGAIMILFGNIWQGVLVIVGHFVLTTNVDNILRPKLIPKEARLDPALMLVSVFAGIAMFGFLGIVIGPTLMVLVVTTIQVYLEVVRSEQAPQNTKKSLKA